MMMMTLPTPLLLRRDRCQHGEPLAVSQKLPPLSLSSPCAQDIR
jgi:hypothetical protein